ncbi:hypothetical protein NA57DRAFT_71733 [Rhizodiscina lignyota]|uniref:SWR1-complex protein 3 domain-containing protein n=1 Tax=Rhizodiscina lignyota TaxID=1504668 RepID=A0A9P4M9F6_9PEZI|nr:hypothetical protein NA57DRAFT_71733 [Rhizodiscina lignyota]
MAEEEAGQKRRYSTRVRTESAAKRQAVEVETPKPKETPKSTPSRSATKLKGKEKLKTKKGQAESIVVDDEPAPKIDILPSKLVDGKPLPTVKELPKEYGPEYQTIKESGVLAVALARSRRQWTTEGVFDKYWTKPPTKKKGEQPTQPREKGKPGEKIGQCQLMVEPHIFDITLYMVKENIPPVHQPHHPQYHQYAPHNHQHPITPNHQSPYRPANQTPHPQQRGPYQQHSTPQTPHPPNNSRPTHPPPTPAPPQQQANTPDPVIQMLAQRASTNPELKSVMKIVATGTANQEQLDYFQKHIDELNKIVAQRSAQSTPAPPSHKGPPLSGGKVLSPTPVPGNNMAPPSVPYQAPSPAPQYSPNPSTPSYGPPAAFTPQPYYPPQPQTPRYSPAVAHPQNIRITALLIEFALDTSSRFLFPPNTILEYAPGFKSCTASFLIKRKAKQAEDAPRYIELARIAQRGKERTSKDKEPQKPEEMDFWQPVTVRFQCDRPDILQYLGRVVKPAEEVKAWMEKVLNGEPGQPKAVVKPEASKDANTQPSSEAAPVVVKEEPKENSNGTSSEPKASRTGIARAESRRLAMRLPKEDKGKENIEAQVAAR